MSAETFVLTSVGQVHRFAGWLARLTFEKPWRVTIERMEPRARVDQEAVLRGMERKIAEFTGHEPDEVHDVMLARHYGTVVVDLGHGRKLERPARRTRTGENKLSETEMREHMRFVEAFASTELGLDVGSRR